jgi:hypothetical protein
MRVLFVLLVCLLSLWQVPATAGPSTSPVFHLSTQSEHHSKPISPKQENQEEEDDLADEDEDFSDETWISHEHHVVSLLNKNKLKLNFYLLVKSNPHLKPILTPPDHLRLIN